MAPRFPHTLTLIRPVLVISGESMGDYTFPAGTTVKGALFRNRATRRVPGQGEQDIVIAQAFLPSGTDVALGDRLVRGADRFRVAGVTVAEDDRGNTSHVGVQLVDAGAES